MKTYGELLSDYRAARSRADRARADWHEHLPTEGIRLSSHPDLRPRHEAILAAEADEAAARAALIGYRGD
jgi:hypothetical protein